MRVFPEIYKFWRLSAIQTYSPIVTTHLLVRWTAICEKQGNLQQYLVKNNFVCYQSTELRFKFQQRFHAAIVRIGQWSVKGNLFLDIPHFVVVRQGETWRFLDFSRVFPGGRK